MKNNFFYALALLAVVSCSKDDDNGQVVTSVNRTIDYTVLVVASENAGSNQNGSLFSKTTKSASALAGATGATVSISVNGAVVTKTTDESGQATFQSLTAGTAAVTVKLANHTTCNYLVDLTMVNSAIDTLDFDHRTSRIAATKVIVFPTSGVGMTKISGLVKAQLDVSSSYPAWATSEFQFKQSTDLELAPAGTVITCTLFPINGVSEVSNGSVLSATYEGLSSTTTVGADGSYAIMAPSSIDGCQVKVRANDFVYNVKYSSYTRNAANAIVTIQSGTFLGFSQLTDKTQRVVFSSVGDGVEILTSQDLIVDINYNTRVLDFIKDFDYYGISGL